MSRQLEQDSEDKAGRQAKALAKAVNGGLLDAVERAGGVVSGLSFKINEYDCLMTVRADFPGGRQVSFVGAGDMATCILKGQSAARQDGLRWRADNFKVG